MAAKKKTTKPYGNKTKFVLGLPRELSAKQVVEKAKAQGITITEAHVYKIRSTAKTKPAGKPASAKAPAKAAPAADKGGSSSSSKRDFVLSFSSSTPASEILRKAKEQGIGLSKAYLYTIRSSAGATAKRGAGRGAAKAPAAAAPRAARATGTFSNIESQFIDAAVDLGLAKATDLLERLRSRLKQGL